MSFSFSIKSKPQSNRPKKALDSVPDDYDSIPINYVSEFNPSEPPPPSQPTIKSIAPIPNRPNKKLKNLSQLSNGGADSNLQFELDTGSNPEATDSSVVYGLNIRQTSQNNGAPARDRGETISQMELRVLREDLEMLPEDPELDDYNDVPVEGFGMAVLSGYGWKEGRGIGRNAKEDVKVAEVTKKAGRGGLGFTGDFPGDRGNGTNGDGGESSGDANEDGREKKGFLDVGQEVRVVKGREMGMKGKIVEVKSGGDILVLRISRSDEKVKVQVSDVAEIGSVEEEKCLRKLELKIKDKDVNRDRKDRRKRVHEVVEKEKRVSEKVNWLRNHIRVRIISKELKGGRLFLKKGVVVDVVGPGMCDISMDESRELVQGVDQELLETALPKIGGPVLVLYGRNKGVYGTLVERDSDKETGVVRDADTQELVKVKLEQVAEYTGDPGDVGY